MTDREQSVDLRANFKLLDDTLGPNDRAVKYLKNLLARVPALLSRRARSQLVRVIPRTVYSFAGDSTFGTHDIPLTCIDASGWVSGVLSVRLHAKSFVGDPSARVIIENVSYTPDQPHVEYIDPGAGSVASVLISSTDTAPRLYTAAFAAPIAPTVRVMLRWDQRGSSATPSTLAISVELVGRPE